MTLSKWLTHLNRVKHPLFNGMIIIPTILTVTLALEVAAQEDFSPIVSTTYEESEPASEDEDLDLYVLYAQSLTTTYNHLGLISNKQNPYSSFNSSLNAGSEDDGSGDNVYYGTGIFGAGNANDHQHNSAFGYNALYALTTGDKNSAFGYQALNANTTGSYNTAFGYNALTTNTTGTYNVAVGPESLTSNTSGDYNVSIGYQSLNDATTAVYNVAVGTKALYEVTTESNLTAVGYEAAKNNTTGTGTVAIGYQALTANTTGEYNTASG